MKKSYLVIWQLSTNEQSRTETPIDVVLLEINSAKEKYALIIAELENQVGTHYNITIIGIFNL